MEVNGWTILVHECLVDQIRRLDAARAKARDRDPVGYMSNANVRTLAALAKLMLCTIPDDPGRADYQQGNTLGADYRHWKRAKFGGRFRLFFRYHSKARIIIYAWVNDERTLRKKGDRNDPYAIFRNMLDRGNPPDQWAKLKNAAQDPVGVIGDALTEVGDDQGQ
jgi:toxin YhaV